MFRNLLDKAADFAAKVLPPSVHELNWVRVTPRIIIAALLEPSQEKSASEYLHQNHSDQFMIWNLSAYKGGGQDGKLVKALDYALFDDNVLEFSLPNHPAPLELLFELCKSMFSWLSSDPGNIAVIHSLSTGRAVMATACYLTYSGKFSSGQEVLDYMNTLHEGQRNVCVPSQTRYIGYFTELLARKRVPVDFPLRLVSIRMTLPRKFGRDRSERLNPFIQIVKGKKLLFSSTWASEDGDSMSIVEDVLTLFVDRPLFADCTIRCYHIDPTAKSGRSIFFRYSFHAGFIPGFTDDDNPSPIRLAVSDLDEAHKFGLDNSFFIELMFARTTDEALQSSALTESESAEADALTKYLADGALGAADRIQILAESSPTNSAGPTPPAPSTTGASPKSTATSSSTTTTAASKPASASSTPAAMTGFPEPPSGNPSPKLTADTRVVMPSEPTPAVDASPVPAPAETATSAADTTSKRAGGADPFATLSDALCEAVLRHLDHRSLARARAVSRRWNTLASTASLWQSLEASPMVAATHHGKDKLSSHSGDSRESFYALMKTASEHWNAVSPDQAVTLTPPHTGVIRAIAYDSDWVVSASDDMLVMVWSWSAIHSGDVEAMHSLFGHSGEVTCIKLVSPGIHGSSTSKIISGSNDHSVRVWDPESGDELQCLESHIGEIEAIEVIDARRIASAAGDYALKVWDIETGTELFEVQESISGLYKPFMGLHLNAMTGTLDALVANDGGNLCLMSYATQDGSVVNEVVSAALDVPDDESAPSDFYASRVCLTDTHAAIAHAKDVKVVSMKDMAQVGVHTLSGHGASTITAATDGHGGSAHPRLVTGNLGALQLFNVRAGKVRTISLPLSHSFATAIAHDDLHLVAGVVCPETPNSSEPFAEPQLTDPCSVLIFDATA